MENINGERSARNAEIMKLRNQKHTLSEIGGMYGISVTTVFRICNGVYDKSCDNYNLYQRIKEERTSRAENVYKLICSGHSVKYVSDLYDLTETNVRKIYYKVAEDQDELYQYFIRKLAVKKDAIFATKIMNRAGIHTLEDFNSRSLHSLLGLVRSTSCRGWELLIKCKNPESSKLYEFIQQNTDRNRLRHKLYYILICNHVETLEEFRNFRLYTLYASKGIGNTMVECLQELQKKVR